jgi:predicted SAM-dependent methyltransferase
MSETSAHRKYLIRYCKGCGVDIGFGGDPIKPNSITMDLPQPYTILGKHPLNLGGDARSLYWFQNNALDYVYSSHCLEDFENTKETLSEWVRVIRKGGKLVLLLPDQKRYEKHCKKHGTEVNGSHKIKEFGLEYLKNIIKEIGNLKIVFEKDFTKEYNFALVAEKLEKTPNHKIVEKNLHIKELKKLISLREKEIFETKHSLRWRIPNFFYKLLKKN